MKSIISFDIKSNMGFFKKPDINDIYLTYNMLHKPALLGILGAILGFSGFQKSKELPEYYTKLKNLLIGIEPLNHHNGNYKKTIITYNNSVGYASHQTGGNLLVTEQTLICPEYRCFILIDEENEIHNILFDYINNYEAEFIPYMGKNEFSLWWYNVNEYKYYEFDFKHDFSISTIFIKNDPLKNQKAQPTVSLQNIISNEQNSFAYFERLPVGYNETLFQYDFCDFAFTDWEITKNSKISNLYEIDDKNKRRVIQLF